MANLDHLVRAHRLFSVADRIEEIGLPAVFAEILGEVGDEDGRAAAIEIAQAIAERQPYIVARLRDEAKKMTGN